MMSWGSAQLHSQSACLKQCTTTWLRRSNRNVRHVSASPFIVKGAGVAITAIHINLSRAEAARVSTTVVSDAIMTATNNRNQQEHEGGALSLPCMYGFPLGGGDQYL